MIRRSPSTIASSNRPRLAGPRTTPSLLIPSLEKRTKVLPTACHPKKVAPKQPTQPLSSPAHHSLSFIPSANVYQAPVPFHALHSSWQWDAAKNKIDSCPPQACSLVGSNQTHVGQSDTCFHGGHAGRGSESSHVRDDWSQGRCLGVSGIGVEPGRISGN